MLNSSKHALSNNKNYRSIHMGIQMFVDIKGLVNPSNHAGAQFILLALYKGALAKQARSREDDYVLGYRPVSLITDAAEALRETPSYSFNRTIDLGEGSIYLHISLANSEQIDAFYYDLEYGANSVTKVIAGLKQDISFICYTAAWALVEAYIKKLNLELNQTAYDNLIKVSRNLIEERERFARELIAEHSKVAQNSAAYSESELKNNIDYANKNKFMFCNVDLGLGDAIVNIDLSNPFKPRSLIDGAEEGSSPSRASSTLRGLRPPHLLMFSTRSSFTMKRASDLLFSPISASLKSRATSPASPDTSTSTGVGSPRTPLSASSAQTTPSPTTPATSSRPLSRLLI